MDNIDNNWCVIKGFHTVSYILFFHGGGERLRRAIISKQLLFDIFRIHGNGNISWSPLVSVFPFGKIDQCPDHE